MSCLLPRTDAGAKIAFVVKSVKDLRQMFLLNAGAVIPDRNLTPSFANCCFPNLT